MNGDAVARFVDQMIDIRTRSWAANAGVLIERGISTLLQREALNDIELGTGRHAAGQSSPARLVREGETYETVVEAGAWAVPFVGSFIDMLYEGLA